MKKTKMSIILILVIGILLSYLVYNIITKAKEKSMIANQLQTIPNFELKTTNNFSFKNKNLNPNLSTVFIYFSSECDFCHQEAQSISQNIKKFKDVQFIFVSTEDVNIIKQFSEKYNLKDQLNITFLYDSNYLFTRQFKANSIPYIFIYNKNKELIKKHKGQLNANGILRALN